MSGRAWQAAVVTGGALLLAAGCSLGGRPASKAPATPTESLGPPVGSIEHPRPVTCLDGATAAAGRGPGATDTPGRPWAPPMSPSSTPGPDDVTVGPLTLHGLRGLVSGDQNAYGVHNSDGWHYLIGTAISGGQAVTVTIGPEQRARAGLEFGGDAGLAPTPAVTFHGCDGTTPTHYLGAFFVAGDGRACVPLDIRVGDGAPHRVVISFFNGACPA